MDTRRFWPFPIPTAAQETDETKRQVVFFEKAAQAGHQAFSDEGGVLGAVTADGRTGEVIPRGGRDGGLRRYWEVILRQRSDKAETFYVDGFENAAAAVLRWLHNEPCDHIRSCLQEFIVQRPGQRGW